MFVRKHWLVDDENNRSLASNPSTLIKMRLSSEESEEYFVSLFVLLKLVWKNITAEMYTLIIISFHMPA